MFLVEAVRYLLRRDASLGSGLLRVTTGPLAARPASWWLLDLLALAKMAAERCPLLVAEEVRAMHDAPRCATAMCSRSNLRSLVCSPVAGYKGRWAPGCNHGPIPFCFEFSNSLLYQDTLTIFVFFFPLLSIMKFLVSVTAFAATAAAGTISMPKARSSGSEGNSHSLSAYPAEWVGPRLLINTTFGTPPQTVPLAIDTGSSDLWTNIVGGQCPGKVACPQWAVKQSTSFKRLTKSELDGNDTFAINYSGAAYSVGGTMGKDTVGVAGITIKDQMMGLAVTNNGFAYGFLGLGFNTTVSTRFRKKPATFPTVLDNMVTQGSINRRAFSLFLNGTSNIGTILFGGIDSDKYYDNLASLPMVIDPLFPRLPIDYNVELTGVGSPNITGLKLSKTAVVLVDSGSPQVRLPVELLPPIYKHFNVLNKNTSADIGNFVDCAEASKYENDFLEFAFKGKTIRVPGSALFKDIYDAPGITSEKSVRAKLGSDVASWKRVCLFGISFPIPGTSFLLGDPVLRYAYTVFDQDTKTISMAQANLNSRKENVVEIPKTGSIPKVKGVSSGAVSGLVQAPIAMMILGTVVALFA
ncbi:hypothetical protein VHEMI06078 [[Torrubiella] hemipterigena]|uniref:Peptidase A1 domain-containing protein n=1 Tax=[Torrubiella] hemipterigena TaxID=1531966 RepID=A0A0A1TI81_9HYPO|nr:hypothetical protein VHEMI06078 [[Torrubiella] hemipterigena]